MPGDRARCLLLIARMRELKLSVQRCAEETGIAERTLVRYRQGEALNPEVDSVRCLAQRVGLDADKLMAAIIAAARANLASGILTQNSATLDVEEDVNRRDFLINGAAAASLIAADGLVRAGQHLLWLPVSEQRSLLSLSVSLANQRYQSARYADVQGTLSDIFDSIDLAMKSAGQDERWLPVQCQAFVLGAKVHNKLKQWQPARDYAERASLIAQISKYSHGNAAAQYQLAASYLHSGQVEDAEQVAVDSAATIDRTDDPESISWAGSLTLLSAIIAAKRSDAKAVITRLDDAATLAQKLGYDGNHGWTAFGPTNVQIHRVSAAVELGQSMKALEESSKLSEDDVPEPLSGRRTQLHIDSAWAHTIAKNDASALLHLMAAEHIGREAVAASGKAREIAQTLMGRERRGSTPGLRSFVSRLSFRA